MFDYVYQSVPLLKKKKKKILFHKPRKILFWTVFSTFSRKNSLKSNVLAI